MIETPKHPFHAEVFNCFNEGGDSGEGTAQDICMCGLERLRLEHAAMKALLTDIQEGKVEVSDGFYQTFVPLIEELLAMVNK